ncbi:MAG TPA: ATP-binding protein, partial [Pseudonocardiaceae bacterium]
MTIPDEKAGKTPMTLIGRRHNVDELLDIVTSDTVPLAIVTGPPGVGRSAVLGELRDALGERGVQTFSTGFYRDDRALSTETALAANEVTGIGTRPMSTTTLYPIPLSILGSVV